MQCELCGTDGELFKISIEGSVLNVCKKCCRYGKVIERIREPAPAEKRKKVEKKHPVATTLEGETIFLIVPDYASKIKKKREALNLKQEELAKKLNERETLLSKVESGSIEPSIKLARKLEGFLKICLVEEHKELGKPNLKASDGSVTIGDMIKIKKR